MAKTAAMRMDAELRFMSNVQEIDNAIGSIKSLGKRVASLVLMVSSATKATDTYVTAQKVLNSTFGDGTKEINKYIDKLNSMTGIANTDIADKISLFGQMARSMGLSTEHATELSIAMTDLSAKMSILYGQDFTLFSKAMLDAVKGESSTLSTMTGIIVKNESLQNTLNELGISLKASTLGGANKAMLEFITVARNINVTNEQLQDSVNGVVWQKKLLTNQVKELSRAFGNMLYPILEKILPVINAILIVITEIVSAIARLFGYKGEATQSINDQQGAWEGLGNSIEDTSNKLKKSLRGFDKLNNITTPTSTDTSSGLGLNEDLLEEFQKASKLMDGIKTRAHEIADGILEWLGFSKDVNEKWHFSQITLGTVLTTLVGTGGIIWGFKKLFGLFKLSSSVGAGGGLGGLVASLFGKNKATDSALDAVKETASQTRSLTLPTGKDLAKGILTIAGIIVALTAVVGAIGALIDAYPDVETWIEKGVKTVVTVFKGLGQIIVPLVAITAGVYAIGTLDKGEALKGLGVMAAIIGGVPVVITAIGLILGNEWASKWTQKGIDTVISVFEALGSIALQLAGVSGAIVLLGLVDPLVVASGLGGLAIILAGVPALLTAMGAVIAGINAIFGENATETAIQNALNVITMTFEGLGGIVGALVKGFADKATEGLGAIGTHLSEFGENAKPFFEATKDITSDSMLGVKYLGEAVLDITKSQMISALLTWATKKPPLVAFGEEIKEFAPYYVEYAEAMSKAKNDAVIKSSEAVKSILEYRDIATYKGDLIKALSSSISLIAFGESLTAFSEHFKVYVANMDGITEETVSASNKAVRSVLEYAQLVPKEGNWLTKLFTGDSSLKTFGSVLVDFATNFKTYAETVGKIGVDKVDRFTETVKKVLEAYQIYKDMGLSASDRTNFKNAMKDYASAGVEGFKNVYTESTAKSLGKTFGDALGTAIKNAMQNKIGTTIKITDSIWPYSTLKSYKVNAYASGGFVDSGEMFVARENGMNELVGHIGRQTAVANNDQIIDGIAKGVMKANMATKQTQKVEIVAEGDDSGFLNYITFKQRERDRQFGF